MKPRLSALQPRLRPPIKIADPFYLSREWKNLLALLRRVRGNHCQVEGCEGPGRIGDHIIELKDGGAALDPENVMLMCFRHHQKKTAKARAKRAKGETYKG